MLTMDTSFPHSAVGFNVQSFPVDNFDDNDDDNNDNDDNIDDNPPIHDVQDNLSKKESTSVEALSQSQSLELIIWILSLMLILIWKLGN